MRINDITINPEAAETTAAAVQNIVAPAWVALDERGWYEQFVGFSCPSFEQL